jgi:putative selenate reductase
MQNNLKAVGANNIKELIKIVGDKEDINKAGLSNLRKYSVKVIEQQRYHKSFFPYDNIKTKRDLTVYDCIHAPCIEECAVSQDVPEYMYHTANGDFDEAYRIILKDNPLPNITGNVCDHLCQSKCTKINYDNPLLIRAIKRFNAEKFEGKINLLKKENNGIKVSVLGAGPSGLSCAYFLALEGFDVELYESKSFAGGMVSDSIPRFRLSDDQIRADIEIIENLGVNFHFDSPVTKEIFDKIRSDSEYIYIGIGAQKSKLLNIQGENSKNVYDQLNFLADVRRNIDVELGKNIAVIGESK